MAAYVILDVTVNDQAGYEEYKKLGAPTIAAYGGRPIARGGKTEVLEGEWRPRRMIMIEFKDAEAAKRWWGSPEYSEAKKLRHASAVTNAVLLEGF